MKTKHFNLKFAILSTVLILLSFCLCGCASVNFVTYHNADGSIYEYIYLTLDEQALTTHGYNASLVKNEIKTNSYSEAKTLIDEYHDTLAHEYRNQKISNTEYSELVKGLTILEQDWENNTYVIGLNFSNSTVYKSYYELMNGATFNPNPKQVEKLFYTKTYYYGTANYGDNSIFQRIYTYYTNTAFSTISPQETSLKYSYSVSTRRFHSDADTINLDSNGNYIHSWEIDPSNPSRPIYFYTISANRGIWILVSTGVGLGVCLALCIIGLFKYFIEKSKTKHKVSTPDDNKNSDLQ